MGNRFLVIMAGGRGERFWPQSRLRRPKHLLPIVGGKPMLTQTVDRLEGVVPTENLFVITNREQREAVLEVVPELPPENVVAEPVGRDTAAAVGLAAMLVGQRDPEGVFGILPADHVIRDAGNFRAVLRRAFAVAEATPVLVTLGIRPTNPATGYGYIQRGEALDPAEGGAVYGVRRFVEKPDLEKAKRYLASGDYFWNAGMFVWRVPVLGEAFAKHEPGLWQGLGRIGGRLANGEPLDAVLASVYPELKRISIDYAVMEKAENVVTIETSFDWDDVGEWPAVARHFEADTDGNVARGNVVVQDGGNNIIVSEGEHLVAAVGVEDLIIIHTPDATLVCRKDQAQEIKKVVGRLGADPRLKDLI